MRILTDVDIPVPTQQHEDLCFFGSKLDPFSEVWGSRDANLARIRDPRYWWRHSYLWRLAPCGRCAFFRRKAAAPACWQSAGQSWPTSDAERWCSGWCPHLQTNRQAIRHCVQFFRICMDPRISFSNIRHVRVPENPEFFIPISKKMFFFLRQIWDPV